MTRVLYVSGSGSGNFRSRPKKKARNAGRRRAVVLGVRLLAVLVLGLAVLGTFALKVREVRVLHQQVADPALLRAALQPLIGERLVTLDRDGIHSLLEEDPWIRRADIRRLPWGVLEIVLEERRPLFHVGDGARAMDVEGVLLPWKEGLIFEHLPRLVLETGDGDLQSEFPRAFLLPLLEAMSRENWNWDEGLREIQLSESLGVKLWTDSGRCLLLGKENFAARLRAYRAVKHHLDIGSDQKIDLRFERQVILNATA